MCVSGCVRGGGREGEREGGRKGGREKGREGEREEGGRKGGRGKEGGGRREKGREGEEREEERETEEDVYIMLCIANVSGNFTTCIYPPHTPTHIPSSPPHPHPHLHPHLHSSQLPVGSAVQQVAMQCYCLHFQPQDHSFLLQSNVFTNISKALSSVEDSEGSAGGGGEKRTLRDRVRGEGGRGGIQ